MVSNDFLSVLRYLAPLLNNLPFKWSLIGSTNLCLHGIEIEPDDIDIVIEVSGLYEIAKFIPNFEATPIIMTPTHSGSYVLTMDKIIGGVMVQIVGECADGEHMSQILKPEGVETINVENFQLHCLTLESELMAYSEMGRGPKVMLLRQFLLEAIGTKSP